MSEEFKNAYAMENTNPILKQIVVLCKMRLCSPALIGSGEDEYSDGDVYISKELNVPNNPHTAETHGAQDGGQTSPRSIPLLSGSSLAGVLRSALSEDKANSLFGKLIVNKEDKSDMSPLWVYDSPLYQKDSSDAADIITIDNVSLDENRRNAAIDGKRNFSHLDHMNKIAAKKGKFDFQAVERDSRFDIRLKLVVRERKNMSEGKESSYDNEALLDELLDLLNTLYIGGKTSRGFGKLECTAIYKMVFHNTPDDLDKWLLFKWSDLEALTPEQLPSKPSPHGRIDAVLTLDGTLLIRDDYSVLEDEDKAHITSAGIPVIYGTSWAGAIRGGLARFLKTHGYKGCESYLDQVFGCIKYDVETEKKETCPSKIRIDASYFGNDSTSDNRHIVTRVKIDRWTGGASNSALFTTRPQFGGEVTLTIHYPYDNAAIRELFVLVLQAIDLGIITVGGETSIGRGLFCVKRICIDGDEQPDKERLYGMPKEALRLWMK